jgi:TPR repeat protein
MSVAASIGSGEAQGNLAILYENGVGVQRDLLEAAAWMEIAAGAGLEGANSKLVQLRRQLNASEIIQASDRVLQLKSRLPKLNPN